MKTKIEKRTVRKLRIRSKVTGTSMRPRLSVFRSNTHIYGQIIDDEKGITLVSVSDLKLAKKDKSTKTQSAEIIGEELAKKAISKKIKKVTFDRNGFVYHGRIKALAEGARKGGLNI